MAATKTGFPSMAGMFHPGEEEGQSHGGWQERQTHKVSLVPVFYGIIVYFVSLILRVIQKPRI